MNSIVGLVFYSNISEHYVKIRNWELTNLFNVLAVPTHLSLLRADIALQRCDLLVQTGDILSNDVRQFRDLDRPVVEQCLPLSH